MKWSKKIKMIVDTDHQEILSTNYMYILQKLKLGSLPLAIELHQPGIHFYHVLKKHHLLLLVLTSF